MDGYRVFTWDTEAFPDVAGMLRPADGQGFRVITIIDPGVKYEPGYWVFDQALERDVLCRTEGGDIYIGQVWPGNTAFPDFVTEEARAWWGELNAAHVQSGLAGIWNDMNEPATGAIPPDAMRFDGGRYSHERYHNQYALLMAMGTTAGLLPTPCPTCARSCCPAPGFAGIQRYAANWMGDNQSRWDHLWLSIPMAMGLGVSPASRSSAPTSAASRATPTPSCSCAGCSTARSRRSAATTPRSATSTSTRGRGATSSRTSCATRSGCATGCCPTSTPRSCARPRPARRSSGRWSSTTSTTRSCATSTTSTCSGPTCSSRRSTIAGSTARQVYLPAGDWYDWHTDERWSGAAGSLLTADADGSHPALRPRRRRHPDVAGGAAVDRRLSPGAIELHLFVPRATAAHDSLLQEDDGLTTAALDGARYRTTFAVTRRGDVEVDAPVDGDGYPEFAREAFRLVVHGAARRPCR